MRLTLSSIFDELPVLVVPRWMRYVQLPLVVHLLLFPSQLTQNPDINRRIVQLSLSSCLTNKQRFLDFS
jgi:hypothetical protein